MWPHLLANFLGKFGQNLGHGHNLGIFGLNLVRFGQKSKSCIPKNIRSPTVISAMSPVAHYPKKGKIWTTANVIAIFCSSVILLKVLILIVRTSYYICNCDRNRIK